VANDALVGNRFVHFQCFIVADIVNFCNMTIKINRKDIIYLFILHDELIDVIMDLTAVAECLPSRIQNFVHLRYFSYVSVVTKIQKKYIRYSSVT